MRIQPFVLASFFLCALSRDHQYGGKSSAPHVLSRAPFVSPAYHAASAIWRRNSASRVFPGAPSFYPRTTRRLQYGGKTALHAFFLTSPLFYVFYALSHSANALDCFFDIQSLSTQPVRFYSFSTAKTHSASYYCPFVFSRRACKTSINPSDPRS